MLLWVDTIILDAFVRFQYTLANDSFQLGYNAEGHCKGDVDPSLPRPVKLSWEIPPEVSSVLKFSIKHFPKWSKLLS